MPKLLRERLLVEVGELVDTGDRGASVRDVVTAPGSDLRDLGGDVVPCRHESATRLDVLEVRPGLLGELSGQILDEPRTTRWIEHLTDVRLLQQQQLGVAGDATGEAGRRPVQALGNRGVEREHLHGVGSPTPAEKAASVVRSMFTHGSRWVIIGSEVTA